MIAKVSEILTGETFHLLVSNETSFYLQTLQLYHRQESAVLFSSVRTNSESMSFQSFSSMRWKILFSIVDEKCRMEERKSFIGLDFEIF